MITQLQPLISKSIKRKFDPGATILYQGEAPRSACVLVSGVVRVYSISSQGNEQIVMFHVTGEFFPSSWIFGKAPSTMFFYEALTECEVALVDRTELIEFMLSDKNKTLALLDYFTTNYAASLIRVNGLEQSKARDKLIYTLYYLCQRYVKNTNETTLAQIPISLTHQHLAALVGLTRETAAMEMNKLKREGLIKYKQQQYTVNLDKLIELIGEDSFKDLSIIEKT